jgi:hypothetical protein
LIDYVIGWDILTGPWIHEWLLAPSKNGKLGRVARRIDLDQLSKASYQPAPFLRSLQCQRTTPDACLK